MEGGDADSPDNEIVAEVTRGIGAVVMGRKMFSGGSGPWETDPNADAWWGDDPPFHVPVFVAHPSRARAARQAGRHDVPLRHRRHRARRSSRRARRPATWTSPSPAAASVVQQYLAAGLAGRVPDPRRAGPPGRRRPPLRRHRACAGRAGSGEGGGVARRHPSPLPCRAARRPRPARRRIAATVRARERSPVPIATMPSTPTITGTKSAGWNPSSTACGEPPSPVLALITAVVTASASAPPNWKDVLSSPPASPCSLGRDAARGGDVERPEREREAEAGEQERRQHRRQRSPTRARSAGTAGSRRRSRPARR